MSAHGMTLEQVEEFRDALVENKSDFGVKSVEIVKSEDPLNLDEWGVRIVYTYDDAGNRVESDITVFEDFKLASIMQTLYHRAGG